MVTASGMEPPVSPFARHRISGATPACSQASSVPVRPQPVITSSAMNSTPWRAQIARISASTCGRIDQHAARAQQQGFDDEGGDVSCRAGCLQRIEGRLRIIGCGKGMVSTSNSSGA